MNRKKKSPFRRLGALAAAALMTLQVAGCGKEESVESDSTAAKWVWVPEYVTIEGEGFTYYDTKVEGGSLCTVVYDFDETTGISTRSLGRYSLEDGSFVKTPIQWEETGDSGWNINAYAMNEDGGFTAVVSVMTYDGYPGAEDNTDEEGEAEGETGSEAGAGGEDGGQEEAGAGGEDSGQEEAGAGAVIGAPVEYRENMYLSRFDKDGKTLFTVDISEQLDSEDGVSYVRSVALDEQGRVYVAADSSILLYDQEGNYKGTVSLSGGADSWVEAMGQGRDGKVYLCSYNREADAGGYALTEIDFDGVKTGAVYKNFPRSNGETLVKGKEKDFLVYDGDGLYEYDLATQTKEEVFRWLDSDINGNYVRNVGVLEDGRVVAVIQDWEQDANSGVALLTRTDASQVPQKETIVLATLNGSYNLKPLMVEFNKNSDKYRITVKEYLDTENWDGDDYLALMSDAVTNLNNDITSGSCPDIIDLSGLNFKQLASKGAFEDLNGFLEESSVLDRSQFLESVIDAYSYQGALISIPATVMLQTVAGRTEDVGTEMGWTLEEMSAYADAHPGAALFNGATKREILAYLMSCYEEAFVNWETGECNFNSDTFKELLQFVNRFPDEYDYRSDNTSTATKLQNGELLLETVGISEFSDIQIYPELFGGEVTFIGFPTVDGGSGCTLSASQALAITSKSKVKEGAWEFIESCLMREQGDGFHSYGFPTVKSKLQEMAEKAVKVEYITDENGEPLLDENGNPIVSGGTSTIIYEDGWSYTYRIPTQEEVDTVLHLLEVSKPVPDLFGSKVTSIVTEEAEAFFKGQKTVEEAAGIIQSRVELFVSEGN